MKRRLAWGTAMDLLARHGRLPEATVRLIGEGILTGLHNMHCAGMAHMDVKAQNVALMAEDDPSSACLIDFGSWLSMSAHSSCSLLGLSLAIPDP